MNIFLSSSLTHVPREQFQIYTRYLHSMAGGLEGRLPHSRVYYALVHSDPDLANEPVEMRARRCYEWDRKLVEQADFVIAEASFPSIGVGIELAIAQQLNIPTAIIFKDFGTNIAPPVSYRNPDKRIYDLQIGDGSVSLMALGLPNVICSMRYREPYEIIDRLVETICDTSVQFAD